MNSANSGKLINHSTMNKVHFKDPLFCLCPPGAVVACWFITQEVGGSNTPFLQKIISTGFVDSLVLN